MAARPFLNIARSQRKRAIAEARHRFAQAFIELRDSGLPEKQAAQQAAIKAGYQPSTGYSLLQKPEVRAIVRRAAARRMQRAEVNGETVMRYWWELATTELPLPPVGPCRHCWGIDHQYQYTQAEHRAALRKHTSEQLTKPPHRRVPFDELGGDGFDKTKKPHPHCPECNGRGRNYVMVVDRDKLSPAQRMAIDEVRIYKDGSVALKMRDRSRAMENLQQLMGLIQPRKPLEVIDPQRPIEENVDILLQTAIDQGLINLPQTALPSPVIDDDTGSAEQLADADAA